MSIYFHKEIAKGIPEEKAENCLNEIAEKLPKKFSHDYTKQSKINFTKNGLMKFSNKV